MTQENQRLRDSLKRAETIIVNALTHQPEDDEKCRDHLQKACQEANRAIRRAIGMPVDEEVFCSECGEKLDKVVLHMFGFNGNEYEYDATVDFTSTLMEDGSLGICICTDTSWCGYDQSEEDQAHNIRCPHCGKYPFTSKHIEVEEPNQVIIGCWTKPLTPAPLPPSCVQAERRGKGRLRQVRGIHTDFQSRGLGRFRLNPAIHLPVLLGGRGDMKRIIKKSKLELAQRFFGLVWDRNA